MPDQLTDEQQQTVDTARNMRINDLRTALRQGGVPYEATYTVSVDDLARVAVLYNVVLGPDSTRPTPAPQNGGGGGGGGGGDVSSSTGDDSSGDSTVTVVVVAAVVIVLLVAVLAVVIVKKNVAAKAQARNVGFDNPMYDTNTQADPGENNSGYMEVGASAN